MKSSLALHIKSWTSKIHPPLPRTPRESQQLLSLLTSSFRRQLDEQYPPVKHAEKTHIAIGSDKGSSPGTAPPAQTSPLRAADRHLQSILSHPLFDSQYLGDPSLGTHQKHSKGGKHGSASNHEALGTRLQHHPMEYFDQAVASGTATTETVEQCLNAQLTLCLVSPDLNVKMSLQKSGAGSRVLRWFDTTSRENRNEFLKSRKAISLCAPFLVHEDLLDALWQWLRVSMDNEDGRELYDMVKTQKNILFQTVKAERMYGGGIPGAIDMYLETLAHSQVLATLANGDHPQVRLVNQYITHLIMAEYHNGDDSTLSVDDFERFSKAIQSKSVANERTDPYWAAALHLYHPTKPDYRPALKYIMSLENLGLQEWKRKKKYRDRVLRLCLDTAELLMKIEHYRETNTVLDFVRDQFLPGEINSEATATANIRRDSMNTALLDKLELGYS